MRLATPSFVRMCWTWFWAVRSDRYNAVAISLFVLPSATSAATSSSRGDSGPSSLEPARAASIRLDEPAHPESFGDRP